MSRDRHALAPACAAQRSVSIVENRRVARDTYVLRLDDPVMARAIRPGQFLMIRPSLGLDPLLARPFALYDVARDLTGEPICIDIAYLVLGRGTATLAQRRLGDRVSVWGPLGRDFGPPPRGRGPIGLVAGGIGQTPFLGLARWWRGEVHYGQGPPLAGPFAQQIVLYYGVRTLDLLACVDEFRAAGVEVRVATNDGSAGFHGYVTDLLGRDLEAGWRPVKLVACGPEPMLAAVARLAQSFALECDVSLESPMACGFGACFSCVAPIRRPDGSIDLRRICVEGPIFAARDVAFD
jgi:dihydroorotate dehydrogenase electron transfer subunit